MAGAQAYKFSVTVTVYQKNGAWRATDMGDSDYALFLAAPDKDALRRDLKEVATNLFAWIVESKPADAGVEEYASRFGVDCKVVPVDGLRLASIQLEEAMNEANREITASRRISVPTA